MGLFSSVLTGSLQGIAERFHGGNTGSNPVGDAKPFHELTSNGSVSRRHKKEHL